MENTNRARLMRPRVAAGFTAGSIGGACVGFLAGSTMFLQGNIVKMFVKMKKLKSQGVKGKCTYAVTLPKGYSQVARWWQGWCLCVQCITPWGSLRPSSSTPTRVDHRLHCSSFGIPTKETIPVYSHLGTHVTSVVNSSRLKILPVTYECSDPDSDTLPWISV